MRKVALSVCQQPFAEPQAMIAHQERSPSGKGEDPHPHSSHRAVSAKATLGLVPEEAAASDHELDNVPDLHGARALGGCALIIAIQQNTTAALGVVKMRIQLRDGVISSQTCRA